MSGSPGHNFFTWFATRVDTGSAEQSRAIEAELEKAFAWAVSQEREKCSALMCPDCNQGVPIFLVPDKDSTRGNATWRHRTDRGEWDCEADDIRQRNKVSHSDRGTSGGKEST